MHESIEHARKPATTSPNHTAHAKSDDFALQRFTLQPSQEVPLTAIIKTLSSPSGAGLTFKYDEEELKHAGIKLEQRITLNVKNATIETLLTKAFESTGLAFERHGKTVHLFPKVKRAKEKP